RILIAVDAALRHLPPAAGAFGLARRVVAPADPNLAPSVEQHDADAGPIGKARIPPGGAILALGPGIARRRQRLALLRRHVPGSCGARLRASRTVARAAARAAAYFVCLGCTGLVSGVESVASALRAGSTISPRRIFSAYCSWLSFSGSLGT